MNQPVTGRGLTAGQLGAAAGVSADTVRYYEKRGLLARPPRTAAGYRSFPAGAVRRIRLIQSALAAGFTLAELTEILRERDSGGIPCRTVVELATAKLKALEERIAALNNLRDSLDALVEQWTHKLSCTAPGDRAGLLESIAEEPGPLIRTREERIDERSISRLDRLDWFDAAIGTEPGKPA